MKIRAIETTVLGVPTPNPIALEYPEHRLVVASIHTENNYTRFEFRELIERRAARYLMPDVCRARALKKSTVSPGNC